MFYIPEVVRYTFAGRKPQTEFFYLMDDGIFKHYEDFYYTERVYFGKEKVPTKEKTQQTRVYEMSVVDKAPKVMPVQPAFKHCVELMNIYQGNLKKALARTDVKKKADIERYSAVLTCAWNWIGEFADDKYKFKVNEKSPKVKISESERKALSQLSTLLSKRLTEKGLGKGIQKIIKDNDLNARDFYQLVYRILISKKAGPRLAPFILAIGREKVRALLTP